MCGVQVYLIECTLVFAYSLDPFIEDVIVIRCEISASPLVLVRC